MPKPKIELKKGGLVEVEKTDDGYAIVQNFLTAKVVLHLDEEGRFVRAEERPHKGLEGELLKVSWYFLLAELAILAILLIIYFALPLLPPRY